MRTGPLTQNTEESTNTDTLPPGQFAIKKYTLPSLTVAACLCCDTTLHFQCSVVNSRNEKFQRLPIF
uniref:Uncharacterized protein n=1 Tax=Anguilla anguilla TaxID=7936 RepID=A0A0E9RYD1_ANGAN